MNPIKLVKRIGFGRALMTFDSGEDCLMAGLARTKGVTIKQTGKFNEVTNRAAKLPGYRARKARVLWLKIKSGALDSVSAAAVSRDYKTEFARFAKEEAR